MSDSLIHKLLSSVKSLNSTDLRMWACDCAEHALSRLGMLDDRLKRAIAFGRGERIPDAYNQALAAVWRPGITERTQALTEAELAAAWCAFPDVVVAAENVLWLTDRYSDWNYERLQSYVKEIRP